jgi:hypothetical protein
MLLHVLLVAYRRFILTGDVLRLGVLVVEDKAGIRVGAEPAMGKGRYARWYTLGERSRKHLGDGLEKDFGGNEWRLSRVLTSSCAISTSVTKLALQSLENLLSMLQRRLDLLAHIRASPVQASAATPAPPPVNRNAAAPAVHDVLLVHLLVEGFN